MPQKTDDDIDEKYNPYNRSVAENERAGSTPQSDEVRNEEINRLNDKFNSPSATDNDRPSHKVNLSRAKEGAAGAAGGAVGGAAGSFAGKALAKLTTKKGGIGTVVTVMILGIVLLLGGFLGSGSLIIHVKETMAKKFSSYAAVIDNRQTLILKKRMGQVTNTTCAIKVNCRFKGMSKSHIKRFEKYGWEVNKGRAVLGKTEVLSLTSPEPGRVTITADSLKREIDTNPKLRADLMRVYSPRYMATISPAFNWFAKKMGIDKTKKIKGNTKAELDESMKNSVAGVDDDGTRIARATVEERDGKYYDSNGNEISAEQADNIRATNAEFDNTTNRVKESGKKAVIGTGKSAALTTLTAGAGGVDALCTAYSLTQAVGFGAKAIGMAQAARYYWTFANTADYLKIGSDDPRAAEYIGNIMTTVDKYGESFTDSMGYQYVAYGLNGYTAPPEGADGDEYRANIMQYALGGGLGGSLLNFTSTLNEYTGGAPEKVCSVVKNPFAQVGLLVGGIALTVATGGLTMGPGVAAAVGVSVLVGGVIAVSVPILQNIIAGEFISPDAVGGEAGNGATAGGGAVDAQLSQAHALQPMTTENIAEFNQTVLAYNQAEQEANRIDANPFDPLEPGTPANSTLATLAATMPRSVSDISTLPATVMSSLANNLLGATNTFAAGENNTLCKDKDYLKAGYATDPFCNIRYGMTPEELERDPDVVNSYMHDNGHIDDDGRPSSEDYNDYITDCIQRATPLGDTGEEGQGDDGSKCNNQDTMYQNFRISYLDTMIVDTLDETDTFEIGPISGGTTSTEATGGLTAVSGTDQELAQRILDSGKVNGDSRYMGQIRAYAAGDSSCHINSTILQILATLAETHSYSVSSLNRRCTGVLTASGRSSYHYANGGGHAVDFNYVDGVHATGGANLTDRAFISDMLPLLPSGSGIGQVNCRGSAHQLSLPPGVSEFNDACNHIHIQVPKDQ
jgi:hypothetical protein